MLLNIKTREKNGVFEGDSAFEGWKVEWTWSLFEATPLKTNMEPENHHLEKEYHLPNLHFWFHVNFQGSIVGSSFLLMRRHDRTDVSPKGGLYDVEL